MPNFRYSGDSERVFPTLGVTLEPGAVLVAEENPDETFFVKAGGRAPKSDDPAPTAEGAGT